MFLVDIVVLEETIGMREGIVLIFSVFQLATISSFLVLVSGTTYAPAVHSGQYVQFGVSQSYTSSDPDMQTKPQFLTDIDNTGFYRADVEDVFGTSITYKMTRSFNNGTANEVMILVEDVNTGAGNATKGGFHYVFVATGLGLGDKVANNTNAPAIYQTVARTYAGASRNVNHYEDSGSISVESSLTTDEYWDQSSGTLAELSFSGVQRSGSSSQYTTTWSDLLKITGTNIWSPSPAGLSPILFFGILTAIGVIVVVVTAVVVTKIRNR